MTAAGFRNGFLLAVSMLVGMAGLCRGADGARPLMIDNGQCRAEIVIAAQPARMAKLAASELQSYLLKITGARVPITNAPSRGVPVQIYVGKSAHTDALKLSTDGLAHGAYRMASGANWLALLGPDRDFMPQEPWSHGRPDLPRAMREWDRLNGFPYGFPYAQLYRSYSPDLDVWEQDDAGTLNAVCDFLRSLGVRWYFPGEIGEVVPKTASVALPQVDRAVKPDFPMRRYSFWNSDKDTMLWCLRMGVNFGQELMGLTQNCHGSKWVYMRDETKKAHPDWYALWDGQRATNHSYCGAPCFSSEGLFRQHLAFARMMFDVRHEPMLSVDACDGYGRSICECPLCKGKSTPERGVDGALSDYVWGYINRLATELYKTNPDRKVSGLSYTAYKQAPQKIARLSPNVALIMCQWRGGYHDPAVRKHALEMRQDWLQKLTSKELYIYDYYLFSRPRYGYDHIPVFFPRLIAEDLRALKGVSQGDMIEVYRHANPKDFTWDAMAVPHLNIYVTSRLWWDCNQDLDALLEEYYTLFYGPAAKPMKTFVEYCEANWPLMKEQIAVIDKALELMAEAEKAGGDSVYGKRVGLVAEYVRPMKQLRDRLAKARTNVPDGRALPKNMKGEAVDGNLDNEACWPKRIRTYPLVDAVTGRGTGGRTGQPASTFQVFGDTGALYFGIRCADPDMSNVTVTATSNDDTNLWSGDYVEILIETQTHSFYRLAVNPAGAFADVDMGAGDLAKGAAWSSGAQAAVQRTDKGWTAEVRVPWAGEMARQLDPLKGIDGRGPTPTFPWSVNVCRQRVRAGRVERAAWSPTGTNRFDDVMRFGTIYIK